MDLLDFGNYEIYSSPATDMLGVIFAGIHKPTRTEVYVIFNEREARDMDDVCAIGAKVSVWPHHLAEDTPLGELYRLKRERKVMSNKCLRCARLYYATAVRRLICNMCEAVIEESVWGGARRAWFAGQIGLGEDVAGLIVAALCRVL
jgi:hypothetical protein